MKSSLLRQPAKPAATPPVLAPCPPALTQSATDYAAAKSAWDRAATSWLEGHAPLDDRRFWPMLELLRQLIGGVLPRRDDRAAACAADEMCRLVLVGEAKYTLDDVAGFANRYGLVAGAIHDALDDLDCDRGDDGYGDLCDSLPLAGKAVVAKILAGKYTLIEVLELDVTKAVLRVPVGSDSTGVEASLAKWILEGENYIDSALGRVLRSRLLGELSGTSIEEDDDD